MIPAIPRPRVKSVKYRLFIRALRVLFIRIKFYTGPACSSIETDRVPRGIYVYSQPNVLHTPPPLCFIYHHIYIFTLHYIKKNSGATAASMLSMLMRVAPRATLGQHDEVRARPSRTCRPAGRVSYPPRSAGGFSAVLSSSYAAFSPPCVVCAMQMEQPKLRGTRGRGEGSGDIYLIVPLRLTPNSTQLRRPAVSSCAAPVWLWIPNPTRRMCPCQARAAWTRHGASAPHAAPRVSAWRQRR